MLSHQQQPVQQIAPTTQLVRYYFHFIDASLRQSRIHRLTNIGYEFFYLQFWVYNQPTQKCALRYFQPTARAYSVGNLSGKRGEPLGQWSLVENSVWVAQKYKTPCCEECINLCKNDPQCKSVIFNRAFEECSFNYGDKLLTAIPLPPIYNFLGIESAFNSIARPNC